MSADIARQAAALLECSIDAVDLVRGGGNNRIFRMKTARGTFALKAYPSAADGRDRIGAEFGALQCLAAAGETAVPQPIALDRRAGIAVYSWIDGARVARLDADDVMAATEFLKRLNAYRERPDAQALPPAAEACPSSTALRAQIEERVTRFAALDGEPALRSFLSDVFAPVWRAFAADLAPDGELPRTYQTLSPSDFGAHNMLRRADGRLAFIDFEYFGWDDPVKLVADTLWHPGSALDEDLCRVLCRFAYATYARDPQFAERFHRRAPIFALRWALIVLNDFVPERWERRRQAGQTDPWPVVKERQLAKARALVAAASNSTFARLVR